MAGKEYIACTRHWHIELSEAIFRILVRAPPCWRRHDRLLLRVTLLPHIHLLDTESAHLGHFFTTSDWRLAHARGLDAHETEVRHPADVGAARLFLSDTALLLDIHLRGVAAAL